MSTEDDHILYPSKERDTRMTTSPQPKKINKPSVKIQIDLTNHELINKKYVLRRYKNLLNILENNTKKLKLLINH